jgi:hypothetical protein
MKSGNKPSIFSDRSGIGSPDELDEYGVWVKSEPEDVVNDDVPDFGADMFEEEPKNEDGVENFPDFDLDFSENDGAKSGSGSDFDLDAENLGEIMDFDEADSAEADFDGTGTGVSPEEPAVESAEVNITGMENENLDIPAFDIDDLLPEENDNQTALTDDTFAEELAEIADEPVVEDKSGNEPIPAEADDMPGADFEFDETLEGTPFEAITLDEINAAPVVNDIINESVGPEAEKSAAPAQNSALETELLLKIANELSSIKTELNTLKSEVSTMRNAPPAPQEAKPEPKGFFDDGDEDEKIALTGDELDNIINTTDSGAESAEAPDAEAGGKAAETLSVDELAGIIDSASLTEETGISADAEPSKLADEVSPPEDSIVELQLEEPQAEETGKGADFDFDMTDEPHEEIEIPNIEPDSPLPPDPIEESGAGDGTQFSNFDLSSDKYSLDKIFDDMNAPSLETEDAAPLPQEMPDEAPADEPLIDMEDAGTGEVPPVGDDGKTTDGSDDKFKDDIRTVLAYMDQLLESLPEEKIEEFARSDKFEVYKKVFKDLGLV